MHSGVNCTSNNPGRVFDFVLFHSLIFRILFLINFIRFEPELLGLVQVIQCLGIPFYVNIIISLININNN